MNSTSPTPDLNGALQMIARRAQSFTLASGAAIALLPADEPANPLNPDAEMTCRASAGDDAPGVGARLRVGSGFSGECVRQGKLLRCDDSDIDERVDRESCQKLGIRSMLAVPVRQQESVVGIIEIFSPLPKAFTEVDALEIQRLADVVANTVKESRPAVAMTSEPQVETTVPDSQPEAAASPVEEASIPELFGNEIFISSSLPWNRFLQSALWHTVALVAIWNMSASWARSEQIRKRTSALNSSVTYYKPSFPTASSYRPPAPASTPAKSAGEAAPKPRVVKTDAGGGAAQASVAAPAVKLPARARLNLASWSPAMPAKAVPEAPSLGAAGRRLGASGGPRLVQTAVVGPAPQIGAAFGGRAVASPGSFVVAPSPVVGLGIRTGWAPSIGHSAVAPAPGLPMHQESSGSSDRLGSGGLVVAPAPGLPSRETSNIAAMSLGGGGMVVAPAPGMPVHEGVGNAASALSGPRESVVPPPPSLGGSDSLAGARSGAMPGVGSQVAMVAPSLAGMGTGSGSGGTRAVLKIPSTVAPPPPEKVDDPNGSTRELPVRLIGLALALPSSSYFSNYEVFIAERRVTKDEARLIKLVYESGPYQRRMSEYGLDDSKVHKVRLKRDSSCDETALQMAGSHYSELKSSTEHLGLNSVDQDSVLPCYRTTVDEYRKAVSKGR